MWELRGNYESAMWKSTSLEGALGVRTSSKTAVQNWSATVGTSQVPLTREKHDHTKNIGRKEDIGTNQGPESYFAEGISKSTCYIK